MCAVMFSAAPVIAVELARKMLILMLRAIHTEAKRLIWVRSLKSRDRPRLTHMTIDERSVPLTRPWASSLSFSSSKIHLSAITFVTPEQTRWHLWKGGRKLSSGSAKSLVIRQNFRVELLEGEFHHQRRKLFPVFLCPCKLTGSLSLSPRIRIRASSVVTWFRIRQILLEVVFVFHTSSTILISPSI